MNLMGVGLVTRRRSSANPVNGVRLRIASTSWIIKETRKPPRRTPSSDLLNPPRHLNLPNITYHLSEPIHGP